MAVALAGNNPGGIIDGSWARSQPGYAGANGMYARFRTMMDGIRAQIALLRSYIRRGFDTPLEIANRWAPGGVHGNNPRAYAQNIANQMGIGINDRITEANLMQFQHAQARAENVNYSGGPRPGESQRDYIRRLRNSGDMTPEQRQAEHDFLRQYSLTPNLDDALQGIGNFFRNILNGEYLGRTLIVLVGVLLVGLALWGFIKGDTNITLTKGVVSNG